MAHPATLRSHAKSLHKRGLITDKQHDRMMSKIAALPVEVAPGAPGAPADPQMAAAVTPASAAQIPATVSVPGNPGQNGDPTKSQQLPAA